MNRPVLGASPVSFVSSNGQQYSVPLLSLKFTDASPTPSASDWAGFSKLNAGSQTLLNAWLTELSTLGQLTPGPAPAPPASFTLKARDAGSQGGGISLLITKVVANEATPANTKVDATLQVEQTWAGLTPASIAGILGRKAPALAGSQPGLVIVAGDPTGMPVATEADLAGALPSLDIPQFGGGTAFTVLAAHGGADAKTIEVKIGQVDHGAGTFTLTAGWSKALAGVTLTHLGAQVAYVLTVAAPTGGFAEPPATGDFTLSGGTDGSSPTPAAAAIPSDA